MPEPCWACDGAGSYLDIVNNRAVQLPCNFCNGANDGKANRGSDEGDRDGSPSSLLSRSG